MRVSINPKRSNVAVAQPVLIAPAFIFWLVASPALASFNGPLILGFGPVFVVAAGLALPGGLLCALAEVLGTRHPPPAWVGVTALGLGICSMLLALGIIGPGGDRGLFIFPVPPLMTLALITLLQAPSWRLLAMWGVALAGAFLLEGNGSMLRSSSSQAEGLGVILGGGLSSMLPWQIAFILQQRARRRAGISPVPAPGMKNLQLLFAHIRRQAGASPSRVAGWFRERQGLLWWLGSAVTFYVVIVGLAAVGRNDPMAAMMMIEWRVADFLGWANSAPDSGLPRAWAASGLIWAAIFGGGVWGAASVAGSLDPGRLAPIRLAVIVLAAIMLVWIAIVIGTLHT